MSETFCPICDAEIYEMGYSSDDWNESYWYCCSMKPFYHMYKANNEETLYMVNDGKMVIETGFKYGPIITGKPFPRITITYKGNSIELNKVPEFDPKEIEGFIKAAVNNLAFL